MIARPAIPRLSAAVIALVPVVYLLAAPGVGRAAQPATTSTSGRTATPAKGAPGRPASIKWTPQTLRKFLVETTLMVRNAVTAAYKKYDPDQIAGTCYDGQQATKLVRASEIVPSLSERLEGKALQCYLASYFGCRVGEWLARAGVAQTGPAAVPFTRSKVKIISQTPDRVVAELTEAETAEVRSDGTLGEDATGPGDESLKSKYTLVRDGKGVWRISLREPSFDDWECREK
jgi:hypothetical protein